MGHDAGPAIPSRRPSDKNGGPMRIGIAAPADLALLAPLLPGADLPTGLGSTVIAQLVRALLDGGDHVILYTLDENVEQCRRFSAGNLTIHVGPYRRRHRMRDLMAAERRAVRDMILSDPPDVVGAHWCYEFALGAMAAGRPTLVTVCDWAPTILRLMPDLYRLGRLAMFAWTMVACRHFAAPSPHIAGLLGRFAARPCAVVGQAIDERAFRASPRSWRDGAPALISVANGWGRLKNTQTLIRAFAALRQRAPAATLTFYGHDHGPDQPAERWARSHGLQEGIHFAGFADHAVILANLSRADICVHPSREESFGQVVLEAMAAGTPVVGGYGAGAVPWLLEDGRAGLLVDPGDAVAMGEAIGALLRDPVRWEAYSAAGLHVARRRFAAPVVAARYRALLWDIGQAAGA
jgi:L-malate glycosyltransferase